MDLQGLTTTEPASALQRPPPLRPDRTSLFLDIDGTLAAIEPTPSAVLPHPRRTRLLRTLGERMNSRVAALSGRDLASIDRILEGSVTAASGVHGLERRRADGVVLSSPPHPALAAARAEAGAFVAARPGMLLEDKGLAFALHYRLAPERAGETADFARRLAARGLAIQAGDGVVELKTPGADKGVSLRAFMGEAPFAAGVPVFVGDDLTDEDAFGAAAALGGFGVLVGQPRRTLARFRLDDVEAVLDWLEHSLET